MDIYLVNGWIGPVWRSGSCADLVFLDIFDLTLLLDIFFPYFFLYASYIYRSLYVSYIYIHVHKHPTGFIDFFFYWMFVCIIVLLLCLFPSSRASTLTYLSRNR